MATILIPFFSALWWRDDHSITFPFESKQTLSSFSSFSDCYCYSSEAVQNNRYTGFQLNSIDIM